MGVDQLEEIPVEDLRGFRSGFRILHHRCRLFQKIGAPWIAGLVEHGVREHIVEENFFRHVLRPGKGGACLEGEVEILREKGGAQVFLVGRRHVLDEEARGLFAEFPVLRRRSGDEVIGRRGDGAKGGGEEKCGNSHGCGGNMRAPRPLRKPAG